MKKILVVLALTSSGITRPDILRVNNKTGQTIKVRFSKNDNEATKDIKKGQQGQFSGTGTEPLIIENFKGSNYRTDVSMGYKEITINIKNADPSESDDKLNYTFENYPAQDYCYNDCDYYKTLSDKNKCKKRCRNDSFATRRYFKKL